MKYDDLPEMTEEQKNINELLTLFIKISTMGWQKSNRKNNTGIGKTFEDLLGKDEDNLNDPDFKGIEIKTHRSKSGSYSTLFTASPDGPVRSENTRLRETYGSIDLESGLKILHSSIFANRLTNFFNTLYFQIEVNRKDEKIYLLIFNDNKELIEKITYWKFDSLKSKLEKKLKILAYVESKNKYINNEEYFKYEKMTFYKFKDFDKFLELVENGTIMLDIRVGVYKSGANRGKTHDHGTAFRIKESDLDKLYNEYDLTTFIKPIEEEEN